MSWLDNEDKDVDEAGNAPKFRSGWLPWFSSRAVVCGVCNLEIANPELADTYIDSKGQKQKKHGHCVPTNVFVPKPPAKPVWPKNVSKSRKGRKSWRKRHKELLRAHGLW